mmetsp:Transcript_109885/g.212732  ORF Transcript_109885/g.212732 Transcript_109885/m.212732 type:complete len:115 (+) Transcript_109885:133-477(+)
MLLQFMGKYGILGSCTAGKVEPDMSVGRDDNNAKGMHMATKDMRAQSARFGQHRREAACQRRAKQSAPRKRSRSQPAAFTHSSSKTLDMKPEPKWAPLQLQAVSPASTPMTASF